MVLTHALGLESGHVRVVAPDVGGGFGGKALDAEDIIIAAAARATGRPVRWTETRSEHLVAMHHGRRGNADARAGDGLVPLPARRTTSATIRARSSSRCRRRTTRGCAANSSPGASRARSSSRGSG
jgi:hypothetical protein